MKVEYYREYSPTLGRDMEYKVFGHAGKPCIAFPCQNGRFYDYENRGLIEAMRWYIDSSILCGFYRLGILECRAEGSKKSHRSSGNLL